MFYSLSGLSGNLTSAASRDFAKDVLQWVHEAPPDHKDPSNLTYNDRTGKKLLQLIRYITNLRISYLPCSYEL